MIGFSIYAGIKLWRIRPGAVRTAEIFLLCVLCYQGIPALLPLLAGRPSPYQPMTQAAATNLLSAFLYVAVWYSYLRRSERVKATYGAR
jgi:heme A synthase